MRWLRVTAWALGAVIGVLIVDETDSLRKGTGSADVRRPFTGTPGGGSLFARLPWPTAGG
ncbi:hypothetical protein IM697_21875 [Streptomyces ferrugineus]|uniref:Uncharacterized protein n=1 Tax=Streptomyces ferrugineus TaxID=1413221 RepID=A0A7M2SWR2_9ACTN|nr:hypothetical protein [Streptomyces ferrugineus]QOV40806.1 hypothetical protein IM697_21875 [Streptomyces ferrugineus]